MMMLPKNLKKGRMLQTAGLVILFLFSLTSKAAPVITNPLSADTILGNIAQNIPDLMRFVTALAYVLGFWFVIAGVVRLKHFGESRTMMSQEHSLKGPIILIVVGTMLIYLPSAVQMGLSTFWADPNPYGYEAELSIDQWAQLINVCFLVIQFIGVIAFIRGLVILSHLSGHGQPGTFRRGLTHIIGGIFCINIYEVARVIMITLGIH